MQRLVERRLRYFFSSQRLGRAEVHGAIADLATMGRLVLIGGMARDIALFGNASFRSDLDFVLDTDDIEAFEAKMSSVGARRNRFGGYVLPHQRWRLEVWPLQRTWAHVAGHVRVQSFDDLQNATFFNCDAIIYDLSSRRLRAPPNYFDQLARRQLDINLRPNPNPVGNAVRAIRYSFLKEFAWSRPLAQFVIDVVNDVGWTALASSELTSFHTTYIEEVSNKAFEGALLAFASAASGPDTFDPLLYTRRQQPELPLLR